MSAGVEGDQCDFSNPEGVVLPGSNGSPELTDTCRYICLFVF